MSFALSYQFAMITVHRILPLWGFMCCCISVHWQPRCWSSERRQAISVVHTAFKTVCNAIELAMIASSTALIQACKR